MTTSTDFRTTLPIAKKAIMGDTMNNLVLQDEEIQKIDLGLEKIMQNGNGNKSESEEDDDEDEDDGNEWDE